MALIARVLSEGLKDIVFFVAGFVLGDLIWFIFAATGLALVTEIFSEFILFIKYLGSIYLFYLGYRFLTAPIQRKEISSSIKHENLLQLLMIGLTLTLGNPRVMVFFVALLPTVVNLAELNIINFLEIAIAIIMIHSIVFTIYAVTTNRARQMFITPRGIRLINIIAGGIMSITAIIVLIYP